MGEIRGRRPDRVSAIEIRGVTRSLKSAHPRAESTELETAFRAVMQRATRRPKEDGVLQVERWIAIAQIVADLGMTEPTLCAILLRSSVRDPSTTPTWIRDEFGQVVADLVDGLVTLGRIKAGDWPEPATASKMVISMSRDFRLLIVRIAEQVHTMRTLRSLPLNEQKRVARDSIEIFAPLAGRFGMTALKSELEDIAFAVLHPRLYDEIARFLADRATPREKILEQVVDDIRNDLDRLVIKGRVEGRLKDLFSIYREITEENIDIEKVFDVVGVLVIVNTVAECYETLGVLHARWHPIPGRFKDYISVPTFDMYQSLHTTIIGPHGQPVELHIRTRGMHHREKFKVRRVPTRALSEQPEDVVRRKASSLPEIDPLSWLRKLTEEEAEAARASGLLDSLRFEMKATGVYACTPLGDVMQLAEKSTVIDFAYAIHTEVGHACTSARVNNRFVPLDTLLSSGDVIEIVTSPDSTGPGLDWLEFVKSRRARRQIRRWYRSSGREVAVAAGTSILSTHLRFAGSSLAEFRSSHYRDWIERYGYSSTDDVIEDIGNARISARQVAADFGASVVALRLDRKKSDRNRKLRERVKRGKIDEPSKLVVGEKSGLIRYRLARCCSPDPGSPIVIRTNASHTFTVHAALCDRNADKKNNEFERAHWISHGDLPDWVKPDERIKIRVSYLNFEIWWSEFKPVFLSFALDDGRAADLNGAEGPEEIELLLPLSQQLASSIEHLLLRLNSSTLVEYAYVCV